MTDGYSRPAGDPDLLGQEPTVPPTTSTDASSGSSSEGMKDTAKQEAANVAQGAGESAKQVAGTAAEEAKRTAAEAQRQAKDLLKQGQSQLRHQATDQQQRLAGGLRSLSGELSSMAEGSSESGMAAELARRAAQYTDQAGGWLENREPSDILDEVQRFARRKPGMFLAIAAGLGFVVGRAARSLKDAASDDDEHTYAGQGTTGYGGSTYGAATTGSTYGAPVTGYTDAPTGYSTGTAGGTYTTPPAYDTGVQGTTPLDRPYEGGVR